MLRVAITGGIGEGKSTILRFLAEAGYSTSSSDVVARNLLLESAHERYVADLAELQIPLDRKLLRERLAADDSLRRKLNAYLHPLITVENERLAATFTEVPLLIEAVLFPRYESVWVVTCGAEEQRRRLLERYGDERVVSDLLKTQLCTLAKVPFATQIIRTNEPLEVVKQITLELASNEAARQLARKLK